MIRKTVRNLALDAGKIVGEIAMSLITRPLIWGALAEGAVKGTDERNARGRADLPRYLFRQRFVVIPEGVEVKVGSVPLPEMEAWEDALLDAQSLTLFSGMEAPTDTWMGAPEQRADALAWGGRKTRHAAHWAAPLKSQRYEVQLLARSRRDRDRRTLVATPVVRPKPQRRGAILATNLSTGGSRQEASTSS